MAAKRSMILTRIILGLTALFLCGVCVYRAWAAWPVYVGMRHSEAENWSEAVNYYNQSLERDAACARCYGLRAEAYMNWADETQDPLHLKVAAQDYAEASERLPLVASYWIGRARAHVLAGGGKPLENALWKDMGEWLDQAVRLEPESGWHAYWNGMLRLAHSGKLSDEQWLAAFSELKRAASILPGEYLPGILEFLWEQFQKPELLVRVTPESFRAYQALLNFLDDHGLWKIRASVYQRFQRIRRDEYRMWNGKAETAFHVGRKREAFIFFRRAFWREPEGFHARAGLLATLDFGDDKMNLDIEETLYEVLSEANPPSWDSPENLIPHLAPYFRYIRTPLLRGLFAWHERRFNEAEELLHALASEEPVARRFLAMTYDAQGKGRLVESLLDELLSEGKPDLRDLLLLRERTQPLEQEAVDRKIEEVRSRALRAAAWRYQGVKRSTLKAASLTGIVTNLVPGPFRMAVPLRWEGAGEGGYIVIRLGSEVLTTVFVQGKSWRPVVWEGESPGGQRWLNLERLDDHDGVVHLGSLRVVQRTGYLEEPDPNG